MARSAEQDRLLYARILDIGIIAGVVTIIVYIVTETLTGHEIPEIGWTGLSVTLVALVLGLYFLKRRKDGA